MKKFQSFSDIENYIQSENIPYTCNKEEILKNLDEKLNNKKHFIHKKTILAFVISFLFISITSVVIAAITLGLIPEHEDYVKSHNGKIITTLSDDKGECVFQAGVMDTNNYNERRDEVQKEFQEISESLENKLSDGKVALFIPIRGLEEFIDFQILNHKETYYNIEDMEKNISEYFPMPKYVPTGFTFSSSDVWYDYESFYKPYEKDFTYSEFLEKLFNDAKAEEKDYYYKEHKRLKFSGFFMLEYKEKTPDNKSRGYEELLQMTIKKGKRTTIHENSTGKLDMNVIEHNGRKYLVEYNSYNTYFYINDELWTIEILAPSSSGKDEVFKIVESME